MRREPFARETTSGVASKDPHHRISKHGFQAATAVFAESHGCIPSQSPHVIADTVTNRSPLDILWLRMDAATLLPIRLNALSDHFS